MNNEKIKNRKALKGKFISINIVRINKINNANKDNREAEINANLYVFLNFIFFILFQ